MSNKISIEELAERLNIDMQTVRYYMSEELIELDEDSVTGQFSIDETNLELLGKAILLRECNVSISDIRILMKDYSKEQYKLLLAGALRDVDEEISALNRLKRDIEDQLEG